jgi:hypothetical protein
MVPVTFRTQVTAEYDADGAGRHLANLRQRSGVSDTAERAVLGGEALDVAIGGRAYQKWADPAGRDAGSPTVPDEQARAGRPITSMPPGSMATSRGCLRRRRRNLAGVRRRRPRRERLSGVEH